MLYLDLQGYGYSQRRCKSAVRWFISKYLPRHHIDLTIVHRGLLREGAVGFCDVNGSTYKPRSFLIEIHPGLDSETYLKTLFHELYHLYDFCKGNLKIKSCKRYYQGINIEELEYEEQPHEIIAHQKEEELYQEYLHHLTHS